MTAPEPAAGARWLPPGRQREAWLLLRFGAAGLLNTLFGYACFAGLILAGAGPTPSLGLATVAGVAFNFQTSRRLVFRSGGRLARFVGLYLGLLLLNWLVLDALLALGLRPLLAQALLIMPLAALSFLAQRVLVFAR